ncbi:unnamed protein product [Rotaria sp. Silwood2]|nr:unnamed protein product [Rotaria sp. Silwood2]
MEENGSLYVTDIGKHEVRRYRRGESQGTVVAGGNGSGNRLDQLSFPQYVFVDRDHSVYVSDSGNDRVMKWVEGAKQGIVVAGGQGQGNGLTQLSCPQGVVVDQLGTVYVADARNDRIMRWPKGATQGSVIVGGNGRGGQSNQLYGPVVPFIDQYSKSELLELSYAYAPEKEYIVDETAKQFDIEIIRLPVRHCILNPIEICWAELKKSVRDQNTTFKLKDVEKLIWNWLNNCDSTFISNCIDHVQVYEENFKKADQFIEQIENELNDDDNIDNDSDLTEDEDEDKGEGEDEDQ